MQIFDQPLINNAYTQFYFLLIGAEPLKFQDLQKAFLKQFFLKILKKSKVFILNDSNM
jgi:hypothetical protein